MKHAFVYLLGILIWFIYKIAAKMSLVDWINASFLAGLICFIIASSFFIFKSGFLTNFFVGFRRIQLFAFPKSNAMERAEELIQKDEILQDFKNKFIHKIIVLSFLIGCSSITVSLIGLALRG
ncbi:DUF3899 domain-containing protein [Neobacillus sp. SM06]|uniref:DUF3899 domain-containing protein n=1 Tax=Neobacillus sp. SM06 TaxID=3422492 RepID=UPI003D2686D5